MVRRTKDSLALVLLGLLFGGPVQAQESASGSRTACVGGFAGGYPCDGVDLLAFVPNSTLGPGAGVSLDLWGWTDPETGAEYVLATMEDRTSFVDVSNPQNPQVVGYLPHSGQASTQWRDVKVYANHAYVVAERSGDHGLQVFDLTQLRNASGPRTEYQMTAHYLGFGSAHNVAINEDTGFAYVVGASGGQACGQGLHMINIQIPDTPRFVGCYSHDGTGRRGTGYTHDVQCVVYHGPDLDYTGQEICLGANETALSIVDVTVKGQPRTVAKAEYPGLAYAHQGWLTEDQRIFILGDELDERAGEPARSLIFDVADLDDPIYLGEYQAVTRSIDHNMYVKGDFVYQANYTAGLRILDISSPETPKEIAFFDTTPNIQGTHFAGTWSNYPYFESGTIAVSSIGEGLFLVQATHPSLAVGTEQLAELPESFAVAPAWPNPFFDQANIEVTIEQAGHLRVSLLDMLGREIALLKEGLVEPGSETVRLDGSDLVPGVYMVRVDLNGTVITKSITRQ